ncbi:uncharacterized protein EV420DRAFT_1132383 [Desarmillaria tabescens]|uniref:Ig-like domain-containing protein n=1 Tax=Armillaria tabescens TaxID=1929756 RepID=A0AA39JDM5_ARMTA|nr:uncharacterized protein EV420DRAFT_1132383 [Desarmillaria tabescens]KAK0440459.1 hypothetical protein EV420DRAFT_1132383 [Desarmillaria tabescens]
MTARPLACRSRRLRSTATLSLHIAASLATHLPLTLYSPSPSIELCSNARNRLICSTESPLRLPVRWTNENEQIIVNVFVQLRCH